MYKYVIIIFYPNFFLSVHLIYFSCYSFQRLWILLFYFYHEILFLTIYTYICVCIVWVYSILTCEYLLIFFTAFFSLCPVLLPFLFLFVPSPWKFKSLLCKLFLQLPQCSVCFFIYMDYTTLMHQKLFSYFYLSWIILLVSDLWFENPILGFLDFIASNGTPLRLSATYLFISRQQFFLLTHFNPSSIFSFLSMIWLAVFIDIIIIIYLI